MSCAVVRKGCFLHCRTDVAREENSYASLLALSPNPFTHMSYHVCFYAFYNPHHHMMLCIETLVHYICMNISIDRSILFLFFQFIKPHTSHMMDGVMGRR